MVALVHVRASLASNVPSAQVVRAENTSHAVQRNVQTTKKIWLLRNVFRSRTEHQKVGRIKINCRVICCDGFVALFIIDFFNKIPLRF